MVHVLTLPAPEAGHLPFCSQSIVPHLGMDGDREAVWEKRRLDDLRVVQALRQAGVDVSSVYDLVNTKDPYPQAIPVLVSLLHEEMEDHIKEGVVRALTVKEARGIAARPLIEEFLRNTDYQNPKAYPSLKWAICNALSEVADDTVFDELVALIRDRRHGKAREMLALALAKVHDPRAADVLIGLLDDDEMAGHAILGLRKLRAAKARPYIEPFLNHPNTWIRNEAKKAMATFDKQGGTRKRT